MAVMAHDVESIPLDMMMIRIARIQSDQALDGRHDEGDTKRSDERDPPRLKSIALHRRELLSKNYESDDKSASTKSLDGKQHCETKAVQERRQVAGTRMCFTHH